MLLLGVLGLAFAGGETKIKKSTTTVQKKVRRTRRTIKMKRKAKNSRRTSTSQSTPSSHGNHMYIPSQGQNTATQDYTVPVNRGQYDREMPRRTPSSGSGTSNRQTEATTSRRYSDSSTLSNTPTTTSTTRQNSTGTITSTTVRQNIPTGSSTRRTRERRTSTTSQDRTTPVATSTTRRDRRRRTTTTRNYPKQTPNIQQTETSTTQTKRRRRSDQTEGYSRNNSTQTRTKRERTEQNSYRPRERQQQSQSGSCYASTTRVGLRGGQHALEMNSDAMNTGLGWAVGFQPCDDIFEIELSHVSFGDDFSIGVDSPAQLTAQIYGSNVGLAPFVSFGVHGAQNDLVKEIGFMDDEILIGMHGGLGVRYKAGPISLTLEGRYGSYIDEEFSQLQGLAGANVHF
ncbi:MAG: hypothetical protein CL916_05650 [Deltaproteobacteria bacterium]|nr:hypothetical protein [Deltaproteobacteria bacterium]